MSGANGSLLDPAFLARLGRLALRARRRFPGEQPGERRSRRLGGGLDFAGHRGYVPGDDLRHLDWPLLGRLDRPYVKTYEQKTELTVHLLIDRSRSMAFGEPSKFIAAARLSAALAYIALAALDRVGVGFFGGERRLQVHGPSRGRRALFPLLRFLEAGKPDAVGDLGEGLLLHSAAVRPGLTFLFSDFMDPAHERLARHHLARRHEVCWVRILSPEELDPPYEGDLKLVDAESGDPVELTLGKRERAAYLARLETHREALRETANRHGMPFVELSADLDLEQALWNHLLPAVAGRS